MALDPTVDPQLTSDSTGKDSSLEGTEAASAPKSATGASSGQHSPPAPFIPVVVPEPIPLLDARGAAQQNEGPSDFPHFAVPMGVVRAVLVFVDFSDAPAGSMTTAQAEQRLQPRAASDLFRQQSYGQMDLRISVRSDLPWRRMPKPSTEYDTSTFDGFRAYLDDAVRLFQKDVVFAELRLVYIATPESAKFGGARAFSASADQGIRVQGGEIRLAAIFDGTSLDEGWPTFVHETGHLIGLPDHYQLGRGATDSRAGCWSIMSDVFSASGFLGWDRHKNGWLSPERKTYWNQPGTPWSGALHPLDGPSGLSMVVLPADYEVHHPSTVFVVELAQTIRLQSGETSPEGVLVYTVDARVTTGDSPVEILPNRGGYSAKFGNWYDAPFAPGDKRTLPAGHSLLTLEVGQRMGDSYLITLQLD